MKSKNLELRNNLKNAYERARFLSALKYLWWVVPLIIISFATCGSFLAPTLLGCSLAVLTVFFAWRGLEFGRALIPGLIAGTVAIIIPVGAHLLEICCHTNLELEICVASGVFGGVILGWTTSRIQKNKTKTFLISALIAGLTAALGCASLGVGAVIGLVIVLLLSAVPVFAFKK